MLDDGFEPALLAALELALGHAFADPRLLRRALTHSSWSHEFDGDVANNERLEFLGDAVLELAISAWLFRSYPQMPEGQLTQMRARVVNARALADLAQNLHVGGLLRVGVGEERTGGRKRRSLLADAFEALLGAVYLDAGFEVAARVVRRLFEGQLRHLSSDAPKDPKSLLQEWAQAHHRVTPRYRMTGAEGPDHDVRFEAEVSIPDVITARGSGPSKKEAQRAAAERALEGVGVLVAD
ncbi:MAG: ribonuclease III [Deltaproteobacteria bacterium]|nr:ribonuclease III [Deltaproteobacteria bacterium]MCB9786465.1 ribonuclease III [Deltaproteobacteria bacterium]